MQNKPLISRLAVHDQAACSAFPFYTPTKPLIWLYFKYKTVLIPKLTRIVRESDYSPAAVLLHAVKGQSFSGY